ncbi:YsnF/AvaK domain-containing protein [Sandarakinorhabdus sp. DWP1-3-1]|uniref:YsnF/AvaK domain-containing protein n=1 Tax=Sandarakinorhabdus sp. DWP1-3-1 TaxID=2804627 RepID=UPI003CED37F1
MRTLTAMFDSRSDAESARDRLATAGISNDDVTILDQGSIGGVAGHETHEHRSMWEDFKALFRDDEDRYAEGLRRGGYLLTARVDDAEVDRAIDILDDEGTVDLDQRTDAWRSEGWTGGSAAGVAGLGRDADRDFDNRGDGLLGGRSEVRDDLRADAGDETRIPVVEEQLRVDKREVARGGVRVRSYIVEEPVSEDVRLREEHVSVDRRPVSGDTLRGDAGDLFRERTVEVTETAEEAVIDKQAHVREEVVVSKTVDERVERVNDTVRHTEVDIERLGGDERANPVDERRDTGQTSADIRDADYRDNDPMRSR